MTVFFTDRKKNHLRKAGLVVWFSFMLCPPWVSTNGFSTPSEPAEEPRQQQRHYRQQHRRRVQDRQDDDGDYYCSLCQGLTLLADTIPDPVQSPEETCGDVNERYRFGNAATPRASCRSDGNYNSYHDKCCKASVPRYECEQHTHELLFENTPYNAAVPPVVDMDETLDVSVNIMYQALTNIDVEGGTATIFLDLSFRWTDPRLVWDVIDYETCTNVIDVFTGHDVETTTIWIPGFDLLNQVEGIESFPSQKASVYSDGTVVWTIAGGMETFCAFSGLAKIPFDTLGCQLLFGSGARTNYQLANPDFVAVGAFDLTYNEWTLVPELVEHGQAFGDTVIYYNFYFKRATKHYVNLILIPTIILTYVSFCTFLLDLRVGERLGFGVALALVVVAQQIVTTGLTPVSDQRLWLDFFVGRSFYWVLLGVVESVMIGFLFYLREDRQARIENKRLSMMGLDERESMIQRMPTPDGGAGDAMASNDRQEGNLPPRSVQRDCLYTFSLRTLDLCCLFFAIATYTAFIILMYSFRDSDFWLSNEPDWFSEEDLSYTPTLYRSNDPNN